MVYAWIDPGRPASWDEICNPNGAVRIAINRGLVNVLTVVRRLNKL